MAAHAIDYRTAMEILTHEAIVRQAYKDSVGKWTWSVGLTSATGHDVERYIDRPASMERCLEVFVWALQKYATDVNRAFAGHSLSPEQFAAALSFHWNTGAILKATWVRKFKAGDMAGAKKSFMDWRKPPEIVPRRKKERDLFFDGVWSSDGTVTEYTRLTKNHTPVWSSAKRVNIEAELRAVLSPSNAVPPSPAPKAPETPSTRPTGRKIGPVAIIVSALTAIGISAYAFLKSIGVPLP